MTREDINNYLRLCIMEEVNKRLGKNFECVNDLIDYAKNLEKENEQLEIYNYNLDANLQRISDMLDEAEKIIKDLLGSESHCCTEDEFFEIREKAENFIKQLELVE